MVVVIGSVMPTSRMFLDDRTPAALRDYVVGEGITHNLPAYHARGRRVINLPGANGPPEGVGPDHGARCGPSDKTRVE